MKAKELRSLESNTWIVYECCGRREVGIFVKIHDDYIAMGLEKDFVTANVYLPSECETVVAAQDSIVKVLGKIVPPQE